MKLFRTTISTISLLAVSCIANAAPETFKFTSSAGSGIDATFAIDVSANIGSNITPTAFAGTLNYASIAYDLILLSTSNFAAVSAAYGGIGGAPAYPGTPAYDLGTGWTWQAVPQSGGANWQVDNVVHASPNYLDDYGLAFLVVSGGTAVGGFNPWTTANRPNDPYAVNFFIKDVANINDYGGLGTLTVAAVPEPETYAMLLSGLGLMGFIARRRKQQDAV